MSHLPVSCTYLGASPRRSQYIAFSFSSTVVRSEEQTPSKVELCPTVAKVAHSSNALTGHILITELKANGDFHSTKAHAYLISTYKGRQSLLL